MMLKNLFIKNAFAKKEGAIPDTLGKTVNMSYDYSSHMHIGKRKEQQDAIALIDGMNSNSKMLIDFFGVLCDGMGGLEDGALVSNTVVNILKKKAENINNNVSVSLRKAVDETVCDIVKMASKENKLYKMGSTLVTVAIKGSKMYWCSIGDSRLYLVRDKRLIQVNTEHNYRQKLIENVCQDHLLREEVFTHKDGNKLISYIGQPLVERVEWSISPFNLKSNDKIILCSDGLFNTLSDECINGIIAESIDSQIAHKLIKKVLEKDKPYQDNISVISITYHGV